MVVVWCAFVFGVLVLHGVLVHACLRFAGAGCTLVLVVACLVAFTAWLVGCEWLCVVCLDSYVVVFVLL